MPGLHVSGNRLVNGNGNSVVLHGVNRSGTMTNNSGNGNVTSAPFSAVSWSSAKKVVNLLLMSWQPTSPAIAWPSGAATNGTATDGYGYVSVGGNLTPQTVSKLASRTAGLNPGQEVVQALQIAVGSR